MTHIQLPEVPDIYEDDDVFVPTYRLEQSTETGENCCHLYLQTFQRISENPSKWHSSPIDSWPRIATIFANKLTLYPINTNPHASRYLFPKHGRLTTIFYIDDEQVELPDNGTDALIQISTRLPLRIFSDKENDFALTNELKQFWTTVNGLDQNSTLTIIKSGDPRITANGISISEQELDYIRRSLNRLNKNVRARVQNAQRAFVFNNFLIRLDPDRFASSNPESRQLPQTPTLQQPRRLSRLQREASRASVATVRAHLPALAQDSPSTLMELHSSIERVTLTEMIGRYEDLLNSDVPEARWQSFFESNLFILSLLFCRPVRLSCTQFHAQMSSLEGTGAQIGDFLFRELGQGLAIVEIKKPEIDLLRRTPYRNTQVYAPSKELSGAITQTLLQQSHLKSNWLLHRVQPSLNQAFPDSIKCVVIAGKLPIEDAQRRSFEIFRNACKDVEVITFDELLEKLRLLLEHLSATTAN